MAATSTRSHGAADLLRREFLTRFVTTGSLVWLSRAALAAEDAGAWPDNRFLRGNFAPVHEEIVADGLRVIGRLPSELNGVYLRTGPNPQFPPRNRYHWFDGDGMLHGVRIQDGRASYRNRYVRTEGWREERKAGKALYPSILDAPDLARIFSGKQPYKNTANTALVWHHGRLFALMEGAEPHEIRPSDLDTVGPCQFEGRLKHAFTAHPKVDAQTGEMMFFGYSPLKPYLQYSVADRQGRIVSTTPIELPRGVMMHDFAITRRFTLFLDLPLTFDFARLASGRPILEFEPQLGARIGVLARHAPGAEIRWFNISPCFVFHVLNAFEDGDSVVLRACRYDDFPDLLSFNTDDGKAVESGRRDDSSRKSAGQGRGTKEAAGATDAETATHGLHLHEWRIDLTLGTVAEKALAELPCEFPRLHESRQGRAARFGYAAAAGGDLSPGALKFDHQTGGVARHAYGKDRWGGEALFAPRPGSSVEDDGWLLTFVYDRASDRSELVVIDARSMAAEPIARVLLPRRVPYGFHGVWLEI